MAEVTFSEGVAPRTASNMSSDVVTGAIFILLLFIGEGTMAGRLVTDIRADRGESAGVSEVDLVDTLFQLPKFAHSSRRL